MKLFNMVDQKVYANLQKSDANYYCVEQMMNERSMRGLHSLYELKEA